MKYFHVSPTLKLPISVFGETVAILGNRGSGKTNTSVVMVEEMLDQHLPVAILDPVGVWWGLKSSRNGKRAGYPVIIFGGDHQDVPLEAESGIIIADWIMEHRQPCLLDISRLSKSGRRRFVADFAEHIFDKNRDPLHLVLEEAHTFAPQKTDAGEERMLGAIEDIVLKGRVRGFGLTLITQRSAKLNKNVLTQSEVLIVLKTMSPQDRKAVEEWIRGEVERPQEFVDSLPSLQKGDAWVWYPAEGLFKRTHIRERQTFDSSATPKIGERRVRPKIVAKVDLKNLSNQIKATVEKIRENDPGHLKQRIRELKAELVVARSAVPVSVQHKVTATKIVEVPVLTKAQTGLLTSVLAKSSRVSDQIEAVLKKFTQTSVDYGVQKPVTVFKAADLKLSGPITDPEAKQMVHKFFKQPQAAQMLKTARQELSTTKTDENEETGLRKGEIRILEVIARFGGTLNSTRVSILAGVKKTTGTWRQYVGVLRRKGYLSIRGEDFSLTPKGQELVAHVETVAPTVESVIDQWKPKMRDGECRIMELVLSARGEPVSAEDVSRAAGVKRTTGTWRQYIGVLRRMHLIEVSDKGESLCLHEGLRALL